MAIGAVWLEGEASGAWWFRIIATAQIASAPGAVSLGSFCSRLRSILHRAEWSGSWLRGRRSYSIRNFLAWSLDFIDELKREEARSSSLVFLVDRES